MTKDVQMHLIDSLKTWAAVVFGLIVNAVDWTCSAIEHVMVILVFVSVVARLIVDVPKAIESFKRYWMKGRFRG